MQCCVSLKIGETAGLFLVSNNCSIYLTEVELIVSAAIVLLTEHTKWMKPPYCSCLQDAFFSAMCIDSTVCTVEHKKFTYPPGCRPAALCKFTTCKGFGVWLPMWHLRMPGCMGLLHDWPQVNAWLPTLCFSWDVSDCRFMTLIHNCAQSTYLYFALGCKSH